MTKAALGVWTVFGVAFAIAGDWPTYGHDPQRSGWAASEKTLNPQNVAGLALLWKTKVNNQFSHLWALTSPVVMSGVETPSGSRTVVYVVGVNGGVFALDASTGMQLWTRTLRSMVLPRNGGLQGTFLCPNGITATPVIDKERSILYVVGLDGALYGLDLGTGKIRYGPVQFTAPFSKSWSLNLVNGIVYTTVSLGCGNGASGVYGLDVRERYQPIARQVLLSRVFTAGIWGRGGAIFGKNHKFYGGTADGDSDPASGDYSSTVVAVSEKSFKVDDYFQPGNLADLKKRDLDVGSASPVWFEWNNRSLIAHGFKEGVIYLMDADNLGGNNHHTPLYASPRLGNDSQACCDGSGIWGSLTSSRDDQSQTWLYVPMGGPPAANGMKFPSTQGPNPHGSIMAFKIVSDPKTQGPVLEPAWISGDFDLPDPVVVANGVVFGLATGEDADQRQDEARRLINTHPAVLKALDAKTGRELFNSGTAMKSWVHFSALAVANGQVYAVDHDSNVYAFGLPGSAPTTSTSTVASRTTAQAEPSESWVSMVGGQDEYRKTWMRRVGAGLIVALLFAVIGLWMGLKTESTRT